MTTAFRESLRIAPETDFAIIVTDAMEVRFEITHRPKSGDEATLLHRMPIPADVLAQVAELLARAAEAHRGQP